MLRAFHSEVTSKDSWRYDLSFSSNFQKSDATISFFSGNFQHALEAKLVIFSSNFQHALGATLSFPFWSNFQHALDATILSFAINFQNALIL